MDNIDNDNLFNHSSLEIPNKFLVQCRKNQMLHWPWGLLQVNITFSFSRLLDICQSEGWELISHIITHFVNNVQVKHLTYPYFWQHCWQLDESPPNSSLLLPKHHKSIEKSILKFGFETIGKSVPFQVFALSFLSASI